MDPGSLLTKPLYIIVSVVILMISGLYVWWHTTSSTSGAYLIYRDIDGQAARAKQARKGRCLLSLGKSISTLDCNFSDIRNCISDGGGIRTLSQITILYEISNRIVHDLGLDHMPRLCNYFDMIGGVGTGG